MNVMFPISRRRWDHSQSKHFDGKPAKSCNKNLRDEYRKIVIEEKWSSLNRASTIWIQQDNVKLHIGRS